MIDKNDLKGVSEFLYYRDVKEDIHAYLRGEKEIAKAETTHFGYYDDHFKWLRTELTGFSGLPNHGKSKFLTFLSSLKMYHDNWKVAVYTPETSPVEIVFSDYLHSMTTKNMFVMRKKPEPVFYQEYEKILEDQLFVCAPEKMPTSKGILEKFARAYEYHGCDMFIIDPFNCLDRDWEYSKRDDRYVGDFLDMYKDFAARNNVCSVVVSHPKGSISKVKNGIDLDFPTAYDLAGGAMWNNKLDNLIFVHRPNFISSPDDQSVIIRHSKIKKRSIVGKGGDAAMEFDLPRGRYRYMGFEPDFKPSETALPKLPENNNFDGKVLAANDFVYDNDMPF